MRVAASAGLRGEVRLDAGPFGQAGLVERGGPGLSARAAVHHDGGSADVGDAGVPELQQVLDGRGRHRDVVDPDRRPEASPSAGPDDDGRQTELGEQGGARVVDVQVGDEDAVHAAALGEAAIAVVLLLLLGDDLEQQRVAVPVQLLSTPAMNEGKNGSARSVSGRRASTSPTAKARDTDSARARELGVQPRLRAVARIRSRVSWASPGRLLSANETAPFDTPAARATSLMVGRVTRPTKPV